METHAIRNLARTDRVRRRDDSSANMTRVYPVQCTTTVEAYYLACISTCGSEIGGLGRAWVFRLALARGV